MRGQLRVRATYFHNTFDDLLEFLGKNALVQAGVPPAVANATAVWRLCQLAVDDGRRAGAVGRCAFAKNWRFAASYTYLDAEVTEAFERVGVDEPGVPGRADRRVLAAGRQPPVPAAGQFRQHDGVVYEGPGQIAVAGYFSGKHDDSTFLSDGFFGNSLLLPNQDWTRATRRST